ncbi:transposase [Streptomyces sp. NPDC005402]|uniref:transposase n=1 Tax=Streptomyces sp. NPDC005402 TaxID=3155338 RepID=UPI0033B839D9
MPPAVFDRHRGPARRLHPVRARPGEDPRAAARAGRHRKKPDSLAADRAYSNRPCREYLRQRGIRHTIPEKTDSQAARLRKGSRGGRPPGFGEDRYKKRNTVERAINRLQQSRAVATHYDKRGYVYLGTTTAAALTIWLRT